MNVHRQQIYPFSQHYYFQMNNFEETWYKSEEADVGWERTGRSLEYHSRNEADQTMIFVSIKFFYICIVKMFRIYIVTKWFKKSNEDEMVNLSMVRKSVILFTCPTTRKQRWLIEKD